MNDFALHSHHRSAAILGRSIVHQAQRTQILLMCALFSFSPLSFATPAQYSIIDLGPNYPFGINNQGQVVGDFTPGLSLGGNYWAGHAINERGQIAGYAFTPGDQQQHALLYSNGILTDLGNLGGRLEPGV